MHWRVEADEVKKLAVEEKIYKARLWLQSNMPAYAFAILSLRPIVTDELPTFAVDDHWRLYVNPDYANFFSEDETGRMMIGGAVGLQLLGYGIIKKIVSVEV